MKRKNLFVYLPFLLLVLAGQAQTSSSYIFRLGKDTVAFEQFTRTKQGISGEILALYPRVLLTQFEVTFGPGGTITHFESRGNYLSAAPGAPTLMHRICSIEDTLVRQELVRNGKRDSIFSGTFKINPGAVPAMEYDVVMYQQMLNQARAAGKDSVAIQRFTNNGMTSYIKKLSNDRYESKSFFFPIWIKTGKGQQIISVDASSSTIKTIGTIAEGFDIRELAARYLAKEKANGTAGALSRPDTVRSNIKGSDFQVTYSRPLKRDRVIFGNIVPWNTIWRLGANFATHFSTTKDLQIGDFILPAGRYTIWMLPRSNKDSCELIFNKAVNIFGTQYDKSTDLVRLPLQVQEAGTVTEQLTITVEETDNGAAIRIRWDKLDAMLAFRVKE